MVGRSGFWPLIYLLSVCGRLEYNGEKNAKLKKGEYVRILGIKKVRETVLIREDSFLKICTVYPS